jgi:Tryptophan-associated transmembrane protein (Trp_oprn_chp)
VLATTPWREAVLCGAVAIVLAGLATAWRGSRWPVMSARFDRSSQQGHRGHAATDSATIWESLSRDVDPTDATDLTDATDITDPADLTVGGAVPRNPEDQVGGGTPG